MTASSPTATERSPDTSLPSIASAAMPAATSNPAGLAAESRGLKTLAIDIGGTGTKVMVLDDAGHPVGPRDSLPTPRPATPSAVLDVICTLAARQPPFDRIAIGFPGVVRRGVTLTAPNLDRSWVNFPLETELERRVQKPTRVANDADVQGFGAIAGSGLEMVITLGTGMGSALFVDGILVPNLELAHHPFAENRTYEQWLGQAALDAEGESAWLERLAEAIDLMRRIFNFDVLYLGGGNARRLDQSQMPADVRIVQNIAGLLGGIALWTGVHGTSLVRAPHSEGAYCLLEATPGIAPPAEPPSPR